MNSGVAANVPLPERVGPYRVESVLGSGGMGVVYRAVHAETGVEVALKTVSRAGLDRTEGIRAEIIALTRIHHRGLVRILDHGLESGRPWYAMELLKGLSLLQYNDALWAPHGLDEEGRRASVTNATTETSFDATELPRRPPAPGVV